MVEAEMSQMGQKRRFDASLTTSGLARRTDIVRPARLVRFVPGTGFNAPIRSRRRSSIRRLDKLSNIAKHCREQQLTMENPRAEGPIRGADDGNPSFRPRKRDSGRTHRHAREGEGTRTYH